MAVKLDWQHIVLPLGAAGATAFVDYLVNSNAPFAKPQLEHAALAAVLVILAMAKKSFIAPAAALLFALAFWTSACAKSPAQDNSQQIAQQEVTLAEQAWVDITNTCLTSFAGNDASLHQCELALQPVHDLIVEARIDAEVWGDAERANWPCMLTHVAQAFSQVGTAVKLPQKASDFLVIVNHLALCAPDAGK